MNISFFEVMPGEQESLMTQLPAGHTVSYFSEKLTPETLDKAMGAEIVSVFVNSEIRAPLIDRLPDLKLIATRSMGFDHIDVEHARSKGIHVVNVTTYAAHPVAEFTFALLLCVTRRIYHAYNQLREGTDYNIRNLGGFNLFGKTIGVAGTGRIGRNVVGIARGFGMKVVAFDAMPDAAFAAEQGFPYVSLEELVAQSDIISLHLPYTKETHHILDASLCAKMKKGVILVNTARGELIDTHALVAALQDGTIWGAGLDVLEEERAFKEERGAIAGNKEGIDYRLLTANHILIDMPNVIVTPHIAFETAEAMQEIERVTAKAITDYINGTEQKFL
ncbi:MAG: NAD(P)-dependent oxidoreductase [Patescibacteria group bacterium]